MSRRAVGVSFVAIAAFLYAARYLTAGLYASSLVGWSAELFEAMLQYVGTDLTLWSVVCLVLGLIYLAWGEIESFLASRTGTNGSRDIGE